MLKRRKVELPTIPEINPNRNEKVAKISEPQELAQESPDADGSLSCIKKPKLDSIESPGKNRSKKYVPPFTASKRFSSRLRLKRINQEKNESKSCRQEAIKCGGQNICGKPEKEKGSAMVLKSNEEKTEYLKCYKNNKDNNKRVIQQAPQLVSELTQHFNGLLLRSGRVCEEMGMLENTISNSGNGGLKEGETCTFNRSSNLDETCMNNVASLQKTNKLDPNAYNFEDSLHTLADTCAKEEYIIDVLTVEEETDQSKITPNANKSGKTKGSLARNGTTVKNIVGYSDINNVMNVIPPQYQEERMDMTICSPSKVKEMKLVEHRTTENMLSPKGVSARKETECKNVVTFATQGILNKPVHKSGCPELKLQDTAASLSQELIGNTLSEMLSIISHKKTNEPSFQSNESDNACSLAQHGDKTLGNSVVHTEMICTEQAGIHESGSSQDKRVESKTNDMDTGDNSSNTTSEKHVEVISFDEKNDNIKNEKIEIAAMNEKLPARANGNMNSQKATSGDMMEDAHKQLSSCVLKECEVEVDVGGRVESKDFKHVRREANNDQEVLFEKTSPLDGKCPDKIARTLPQCKERVVVKNRENDKDTVTGATGDTDTSMKGTNSGKMVVATPTVNLVEHRRTGVTQNESKQVSSAEEEDFATFSNILDDESFTEEFEALEKLLPKDDVEFFDDMILSQPNSISVDTELPDGESTIEFLIKEVNSLQCMVTNHERAVEDIKRQYKPVRSWSTVNTD